MPDGRCDIILRYNLDCAAAPMPIITGPATRPYTVDYKAGDSWLGLRLRPNYGSLLWQQQIKQAVDTVLFGEDAIARLPRLASLTGAALTCENLAACFEIETPPIDNHQLTRAVDVIHTSGGRIRIEALAKGVGWTPRQLNRKFRSNTGLTTKTYAQLVQFHRSLKLRQHEQLSISDTAFEAGYADHAHLTRAFQRFGGFAPSNIPPDLALPSLFA